MGRSQRDAEHHTYADYLTWHDDLRYERIDGVAYSMAPAPTLAHQDVVGEIYRLEQGAYGRPSSPSWLATRRSACCRGSTSNGRRCCADFPRTRTDVLVHQVASAVP